MKNHRWVATHGLACVLSIPLLAVKTNYWQVGSFEDLLQGTLENVSVSKDGELRIAPQARAIFSPDENMALSLAGDGENLYVGPGHEGKVFRVDAPGKGSLVFTAPEPDIFAMAVGTDRAPYLGSPPEG